MKVLWGGRGASGRKWEGGGKPWEKEQRGRKGTAARGGLRMALRGICQQPTRKKIDIRTEYSVNPWKFTSSTAPSPSLKTPAPYRESLERTACRSKASSRAARRGCAVGARVREMAQITPLEGRQPSPGEHQREKCGRLRRCQNKKLILLCSKC